MGFVDLAMLAVAVTLGVVGVIGFGAFAFHAIRDLIELFRGRN